ncbi:MAG: transglutaminase domain-containing protein, partial [Clostridia bacterium]|nr:transglutaminase domain-containing protein [Clostridia bacterium]
YKTEESAGLMEWLRAQGFSVSAQYIEYETARAGTAPGLSEFEVDNVGAYRKYAYTPYEVAGVSKRSIQEIYDWQYQSDSFFGTDNYTYTSAASEIPNELMVAQSMEGDTAKAYTEAENIYRAFVHDHYLTIEDDQADEMKELFFSNENVQEENVYQVTTQIRIALQQMARYSEKPYEYPENQEFVDWFLNRAKVGNAAYFATAATMAFRAAGIPARYVEGYFLTESKANELKAADASSVTLTAHDTHAWTEIYIDGIGWMPVEVVPGFYFAEYTTQQVLDMPQSAVAVTDQEEQEELQGSTTDKLEALTDENNPEEETPIEKTVRILGILVGIAVFLELCFLIIQLQHSVRKGSYKRKLNKADTDEKAAILYDTVSLIFMIDKIPGSSEFPYERTTDVSQHYESVDPKDYERFLSLVQKSRFSTEELKTNEIHAITAFTEKITQESYKNARGWKKLLMKYWYIVYDC